MGKAGKSGLQPSVATSSLQLVKIDPESDCGFKGDKADAGALLAELHVKLAQLQIVLYAQHKHKVLVVMQAMDAGGKDGVIRKVFTAFNPQGVRITSFKAPTAQELDHDYLWRVHPHVPGKGEIAVFNRSHYEDVLITRAKGWITPAQCKLRYRHINDFEAMLSDEGVTILKFFLHISKAEQKARLQDRLDDPNKHWKFNAADLQERERWDAYQLAFQDAIRATSHPHAPWFVVPADRKWLRDIYVAQTLVNTLESLKMTFPEPQADLKKIKIR